MKIATLSCPGTREINEDSLTSLSNDKGSFCFVVADGLGGHGMGDVASQAAVAEFEQVFWANEADETPKDNEEFLRNGFENSQKRIMTIQAEKKNKNGIKTTCVALSIRNDSLMWAHIGDSRLYAFRRGKLIVRTQDHSVPQILVRTREIKEKQIRFHPDRNKLLQVIGVPWTETPYEFSDSYSTNSFDAFLLCTDGFWELITEKEMCKCLKKSATPEEWIAKMEHIVCENGQGKEMDNYSAIAVFTEK